MDGGSHELNGEEMNEVLPDLEARGLTKSDGMEFDPSDGNGGEARVPGIPAQPQSEHAPTVNLTMTSITRDANSMCWTGGGIATLNARLSAFSARSNSGGLKAT